MARQDQSDGSSDGSGPKSEGLPNPSDGVGAREGELHEEHHGLSERAAHVVEDAAHVVEDAAHAVEDAVHAIESPLLRWASTHPRQVQFAIWGFIILVMAVAFGLFFTGRLNFGNAGYLGAFAANLIASAAIVLPAPGLLAICGAAAEEFGNNPFLLAISGAVGSSFGETTAWLAGFSEHKLVERFKWYPKIHDWMDRGGGLTIFIASAIPNPLFDFAGIAAGALGYSYRKFILFTTLGRSVRYVGTVYLCRAGIDWVTSNAESGGIMDVARNWISNAWDSVVGIFSVAVLPLVNFV